MSKWRILREEIIDNFTNCETEEEFKECVKYYYNLWKFLSITVGELK